MAIILSPEPLMDDDPEISPSADGGDHLTGENAAANMAHELGHAENNMNGTSITYNVDEAQKTNGNIAEKLKGNANEKKSIYYENQVRQKEGEPARSYDYYKANKEE